MLNLVNAKIMKILNTGRSVSVVAYKAVGQKNKAYMQEASSCFMNTRPFSFANLMLSWGMASTSG